MQEGHDDPDRGADSVREEALIGQTSPVPGKDNDGKDEDADPAYEILDRPGYQMPGIHLHSLQKLGYFLLIRGDEFYRFHLTQ